MTDAEPLFIDTNALVYANIKESPAHEQALLALQIAFQSGRPLWTSRQVLREYLVIMTRPQAFETLSRKTVLKQIQIFTRQFQVADDTAEVTQQLMGLIEQYTVGGKQVHDANIVATMLANNVSCPLTNNSKDFARYADVITLEGLTI